jgi:hypothetical protein
MSKATHEFCCCKELFSNDLEMTWFVEYSSVGTNFKSSLFCFGKVSFIIPSRVRAQLKQCLHFYIIKTCFIQFRYCSWKNEHLVQVNFYYCFERSTFFTIIILISSRYSNHSGTKAQMLFLAICLATRDLTSQTLIYQQSPFVKDSPFFFCFYVFPWTFS